MAIGGIPLALAAMAGAVGLWFVPDVDHRDAWPMLAVGSLIGSGIALLGLHVSFNREFFIADRKVGELVHRTGFGPWTRTRRRSLAEVRKVVCERLPGRDSYGLILVTDRREIRMAVFVQPEPIQFEGLRWALFLDVPLDDRISAGPAERLSRRLAERRKS